MTDKIETNQPSVDKLIPANGQYPSAEEAKKLAKQKEIEVRQTLSKMPYTGGRAG